MHIAFIVRRFPSVSETFIVNEIAALKQRGHQVSIYVQKPADFNVPVHPKIKKYGLLDNSICHFPPSPSGNAFLRRIKSTTRSWIKSPRLTTKALLADIRTRTSKHFPLVARYADWQHVDVAHCHFGTNAALGIQMKQLGIARRVVVVFHAHELVQGNRIEALHTSGAFSDEVDLFMPVTKFWQDTLSAAGCREDKIQVHHMGIDMAQFKFRPRSISRPLNILTVGRLVEKKGTEYVIRALRRLIDQDAISAQEVHLKIVGDGPLKTQLCELVRDLGVDKQVEFLGWRTQDEVSELHATSDVFILPSVTAADGDKEGIPVSLMEAMATGLPVISTWHSGIPELIDDQVNGYLCNERDADQIADRLALLIRQPDLATRMTEAARRKVEAEFNTATLSERMERVYATLG